VLITLTIPFILVIGSINGNTTVTFKAGSTGSSICKQVNLVYNTSDQFQFSGGDVAVDNALTVGVGYGSTGTSLSATGNIQAKGNATIDGTN